MILPVHIKLRGEIGKFFAWWKRHLKVYHLLMQLLAGLITYLLLAIYCHEHCHERFSIKRVRELRIAMRNEAHALAQSFATALFAQLHLCLYLHAKT